MPRPRRTDAAALAAPPRDRARSDCGLFRRNSGLVSRSSNPLAATFLAALPTSRHAHRRVGDRSRSAPNRWSISSQVGEPSAGRPASVSRTIRASGSPKLCCGPRSRRVCSWVDS